MKTFLNQTSWRHTLIITLILLTILCGSCLSPNGAPVISGMEAEKNYLYTAESCMIRAVASDPDGDELSYQWTTTSGDIYVQSASAIWTAPDTEGTYTITVMVTDGRGGEAAMTLSLGVRLNKPPVIMNLVADPTSCRPAQSVSIKCIAYDPSGDELSYQWTTTDGDID